PMILHIFMWESRPLSTILTPPSHDNRGRGFFRTKKIDLQGLSLMPLRGNCTMNAWIILVLAGLCEVGWPLGFKLASTTGYRLPFFLLSAASMALSGWLLFMAQKSIPMGTAYAVWTSIGAVGTFAVGIMLFNDMLSVGRIVGICLIVCGVVVLKLSGTH
ncbi:MULTISPECIES: multidrug efflux SMR transporter, partial [unclassified Desulfovibrio]|uniref:DMT family transporter n=1 Tax=unclassified Desulfovibrio TaxID=2593640 RepID=UPI0028929E17